MTLETIDLLQLHEVTGGKDGTIHRQGQVPPEPDSFKQLGHEQPWADFIRPRQPDPFES